MKSPHLLNLGNARKVKQNLSAILDAPAMDCIEAEIEANVRALLALGIRHYRFAYRQSAPNWRQKVSRLYYAAYNSGRAVRLYVAGDYSTEVKDHQNVDKMPDDFPNRARYVNQLPILREDRNACDYDHLATASDLALGTHDSSELVKDFLDDVTTYLRGKGLTL